MCKITSQLGNWNENRQRRGSQSSGLNATATESVTDTLYDNRSWARGAS